jgi:hypothetical protein
MLQWYYRLMPRPGNFFPLFEQHAAVVVGTARALRVMLNGGNQLKLRRQEILAHEHVADSIAREVCPPAPRAGLLRCQTTASQ